MTAEKTTETAIWMSPTPKSSSCVNGFASGAHGSKAAPDLQVGACHKWAKDCGFVKGWWLLQATHPAWCLKMSYTFLSSIKPLHYNFTAVIQAVLEDNGCFCHLIENTVVEITLSVSCVDTDLCRRGFAHYAWSHSDQWSECDLILISRTFKAVGQWKLTFRKNCSVNTWPTAQY